MKKLSVILLSLMLCLPLCAQFKGTVYIDSNQSGILDKSDKPLMGVMVTDGLNVVKTDKKRSVLFTRIRKNKIYHYYHPYRIRNATILFAYPGKQRNL